MIRHEAPVLEQRGVRNTSGISETRYVIREELVLSSRQPAWRVVVFCAGVVGLHLA